MHDFGINTQSTPAEIAKARKEANSKFSYQTKRFSKNTGATTFDKLMNQRILDVRNYKNFRTSKDMVSSVSSNPSNVEKTVSRSYLCSLSDFFYSEHLDLSIQGVENKIKPYIQTLIINEYQPYSADYGIIRGAAEGLDTLLDHLGAVGTAIKGGAKMLASTRRYCI